MRINLLQCFIKLGLAVAMVVGATGENYKNDMYKELIHSSPSPFAITDRSMKIIDASKSFYQLYDQLPHEKIKNCLDKAADGGKTVECRLSVSSQYIAVVSPVLTRKKEGMSLMKKSKPVMLFGIHFIAPEVDPTYRNGRISPVSADLFHQLCDIIDDYAILMIDPEGYVMTWNKGAERLKQYNVGEIIGKHFSVFYTEQDKDAGKPKQDLRRALTDSHYIDELWMVRKDGTKFWGSITITPLFKDNNHIGFGKVTKDLTPIKTAYDEAVELKNDFLATASHELRSPLNGVLAGIQLLATTDLSAEQDEIFTIIQQAGVTLSHIIDDLLMYTKLGAKKLSLKMAEIDVGAIIKNLVSTYMLQQDTGTHITYDIDFSVPKYATGDPVRFTQIISNLIDNANKFTANGEVKIKVWAEKMPETDGEKFRLFTRIRDTGIGMDQKTLNKLFQPYAQADTSTNKKPGTGLGLSITRDLIYLMEGDIKVESILGKGTTIDYSVVLGRGTQTRPSVTTISSFASSDTRIKILMAEDNMVNALLLNKLLTKAGYLNVQHAVDGLQAVRMFMDEEFDIVLLDIRMPIMDGYEAAAKIRALNDKVPIIALSANAAPEDIQASMDAGMNGHVSKPFDIKKLLNLMKKLLK